VIPGSRRRLVDCAKDLKPFRVMLFRCKQHHPFHLSVKPIENSGCFLGLSANLKNKALVFCPWHKEGFARETTWWPFSQP
jgi:hypothetical protein